MEKYIAKLKYFSCIVYCTSFIVVIAGCAKVETTRVNTVSNLTSQTTISFDVVNVNNEFDNALDDAITLLCNHEATFNHAIADSISPNVYELDYFGDEADTAKSRKGDDSIHLGTLAWGEPGATASVYFGDANSNEYEVTWNYTNTSLRFAGSASITNIYGGLLQNLVAGDSVVVHIRASFAFTYNDQAAGAQTFTWYLNQVRSFTVANSNMYATTRGDTLIDGSSDVGTWGTDRLSTSFYAITNAKIVQNISNPYFCYNPISGSTTIDEISEPIFSVYGVTQQGGAYTGGAPYGFYINWTNGTSTSAVIPYYY